MSNCKCKSVSCNPGGFCEVVTQDSKNKPQFYFSSVPYNVMDSMCGGCSISDVSISENLNENNTCSKSQNSFYNHRRGYNSYNNRRNDYYLPRQHPYFGKNDPYNEPVHSCSNQMSNSFNLSCRSLPNGAKVYTHKTNGLSVVPDLLPYDIPSYPIRGVPFKNIERYISNTDLSMSAFIPISNKDLKSRTASLLATSICPLRGAIFVSLSAKRTGW